MLKPSENLHNNLEAFLLVWFKKNTCISSNITYIHDSPFRIGIGRLPYGRDGSSSLYYFGVGEELQIQFSLRLFRVESVNGYPTGLAQGLSGKNSLNSLNSFRTIKITTALIWLSVLVSGLLHNSNIARARSRLKGLILIFRRVLSSLNLQFPSLLEQKYFKLIPRLIQSRFSQLADGV